MTPNLVNYPNLLLIDNPFISIPPISGYERTFRPLFTSRSKEVAQICRLASKPNGLFVIAPFGGGKTVVLLEALSRMREAGALSIYACFEPAKGFLQVLVDAARSDGQLRGHIIDQHQTLRKTIQDLCNSGQKVVLAVDDLDRAHDIGEIKQVTDDVRGLLSDGASVVVTGQPFGVTFDLHTSAGGVFHGVTIPEFTENEFREMLEKYLGSVHANTALPALHPFDKAGVDFICRDMAAAKLTPRLFNFAVSELVDGCEALGLTFIPYDVVLERWPNVAQRAVKSLKPIQLKHLEIILNAKVVSEDTPKAIAALGESKYAEYHEVQTGVLRPLVEKNLVYLTKEQGKDQYRLTPHATSAVLEALTQKLPNTSRVAVLPSRVRQPGEPVTRIKIFLASSAELRDDRDAFDLYFRQQNDRFIKQGVYLEIVRWEKFLNAMSETRLQDEYNAAVSNCDIFVSLFFTKAGKFTDEEFRVAFSRFKESGKPLVYTFFKQADINIGSTKKADLKSLWAFQKKLEDLGHFHTGYKSVEDLKLQFRDQLDKVLAASP